ncbi:MAG TPA: 4'-phosphopantetheinyl transferase superfamily protein [Chloroflexota bacterium]|nr:4'-phosphopantetheinyl transferase superfamily protein [Chloroflexota bacterium]
MGGLTAEVLREGFPGRVGAAVRRVGVGGEVRLFPEEQGVLSERAVARRREDFALGRAAAHEALAALGMAASPILRGEKGEPVWPAGIVGAITHTRGVAAAVVGESRDYAGIGVDLEPLEPGLTVRAGRIVCTPEELSWATAAGAEATKRLTMVFCAKEALFKALFPPTRVWLDFLGAELRWEEEGFRATLLVPVGERLPAGSTLQVGCRIVEEMALATTYVAGGPAGGAARGR